MFAHVLFCAGCSLVIGKFGEGTKTRHWVRWQHNQSHRKLNKCQIGVRFQFWWPLRSAVVLKAFLPRIRHTTAGDDNVDDDDACDAHRFVFLLSSVSDLFFFFIHCVVTCRFMNFYDELTVWGHFLSATVWEYKSETFIIYFLLVMAVGIFNVDIYIYIWNVGSGGSPVIVCVSACLHQCALFEKGISPFRHKCCISVLLIRCGWWKMCSR